jgi:hypothetical protein
VKIRTEFIFPPIPSRQFDWTAIDDDTYEAGAPIGFGATEEAAIADLLEQIEPS